MAELERGDRARRPLGGSGFTYRPELDGLRAVAVFLVLGFHAGIGWLGGGYLGVSVFFTLSGFLITSLLVSEHERSGRIAMGAFYARRLRRLMPASLATLAAVLVLAAAGVVDDSTRLRGEVLAALAQVLNWHSLLSERTYAELFSDPSPIAHFWSLGIEEQFYWVWPVTMAALLASVARRRVTAVLAALWLVTAVSAPVTARVWSADAAYFATWARASEILAGAVLASWFATRPVAPTGSSPLGRWSAPLGLAAVVVASVVTPAGRGWAYDGGLALFGLLSALVIASLGADGPGRWLLSTAPLVWIGRRSYGIYLVHWPLYLVIDEERTGLEGPVLVMVRIGASVAVAALSFVLLEEPIRHGGRLRVRRTAVTALAVSTVVLGVGAAVVLDAGGRPALQTVITAATVAPTTAPPGPDEPSGGGAATSSTTTAAPPVTVTVLGDSVPAWLLTDGAPGFSRAGVVLVNGAVPGCEGLGFDLPRRDRFDHELELPADCTPAVEHYATVLDAYGGDVAVVMAGSGLVFDHQLDGVWQGPCDSDLSWYESDVAARIDVLRRHGAEVVGVLPAPLGERATFTMPDDHRARMDCVRRALTDVFTRTDVPVVDSAVLLCRDDCDELRRKDGLHVDERHAGEVLDWLVDQVLAVARRTTS